MKLKMKLMAAAVALAASAGANATGMDNFASGNGSLAFIALDSVGSPISMMMDLDYNLNSFLSGSSAANSNISWNFNTNTLTVNGVVSGSTQTNWSGALGSFNALAQTTETRWGVIAGDSANEFGVGASPKRYLTTVVAGTLIGTVDNTTDSNLNNFSLVDAMVNNQSTAQNAAGTNGSTASSGTGYVGQSFGLGTASSRGWQNNIATGVVTLASYGSNADFYMLDPSSPATTVAVTPYAGTFNYNAGVLTYSVAAVPEPSEYALMLAGLGMIGFMARRRLNHRA